MDDDARRRRWEWAILGCMYAGYMGFILCRTAIYAASPAMVADPALGLSKSMFGAVLGWGTAGMVTGKLLSGPISDRLGGRRVFLLALAATVAAAAAMGLARSFPAFCALNFAMLLAAAAGWPAMSKLISAWYEPQRYGEVWGVISTSSRLSAALSAFMLAALLSRLGWPRVFLSAAAVTGAVALAIAAFLKAEPADVGLPPPPAPAEIRAERHALDDAGFAQALLHFARSGRVWLVGVSLMCTTVMMEVLGFLPLYFKETLNLSAARASAASSVFPAGCFLALLGGGYVYDKIGRGRRPLFLGSLLAVATLCLAALLAMSRLPLTPAAAFRLTVAVLLLYGLSLAPAYYLPMSVFATEFGGPRCGLLIAFIDAAGYGAAMLFQFAGGSIIDAPNGWRHLLMLLLALGLAAIAATVWFSSQDALESA